MCRAGHWPYSLAHPPLLPPLTQLYSPSPSLTRFILPHPPPFYPPSPSKPCPPSAFLDPSRSFLLPSPVPTPTRQGAVKECEQSANGCQCTEVQPLLRMRRRSDFHSGASPRRNTTTLSSACPPVPAAADGAVAGDCRTGAQLLANATAAQTMSTLVAGRTRRAALDAFAANVGRWAAEAERSACLLHG